MDQPSHTHPDRCSMHKFDPAAEAELRGVLDFVVARVHEDPPILGGPRTHEELRHAVGGETITASGLGAAKALQLYADVLLPACIANNHPRYLSFVPIAPTVSATLFDVALSACTVFGGTQLESSGVAFAEVRRLCRAAATRGFPFRCPPASSLAKYNLRHCLSFRRRGS